jgi:membrane protein implicated in regulation of membrane protease activity
MRDLFETESQRAQRRKAYRVMAVGSVFAIWPALWALGLPQTRWDFWIFLVLWLVVVVMMADYFRGLMRRRKRVDLEPHRDKRE